jgi:hypothetical protein
MTTPTTPENAQIDADGQTTPTEGVDTSGKNPASVEAAKYRHRAKAAEEALAEATAARDDLAARVERYRHAELERIASASLSNPGDLLTLTGKSLEDFIGEDGDLDADLVAEVAAEVLASRPGLSPRQLAVDPSQGTGSRYPGKAAPSWGDLLRGSGPGTTYLSGRSM